MKKILFILGSYFPKPSPNGICVKQVVNEFKNRGIDITVLATKSRGLDEFEVVDGIDVYRIKARWFQRIIEWCDSNKEKKYSGVIRKVALIINKIKNILFFPIWPLVSPIYTYRYYKKAEELYKINDYDGIISVYTPIDALIAGSLIKKKYKDIKFVLYFLDTLSGGIVPKGLSREWLEKRGYKWDKKLFNVADAVFVMQSHKKHYFKKRYDKFRGKIKIVDIPLMREVKPNPNNNLKFNREKVNIVYTGTLLKHIKNPTYMFKILKSIDKSSQYNFHIYGDGNCKDIITKYIRDRRGVPIIEHGRVDTDTAVNAMLEGDILVNIGSTVDSQIPSKIFEYIAAGKPIISFYKYDTEPSIPYLKKYPLSLLIKEDWDKVDENTQLVVKFINKYKGKSVDYNEIEDMFSQNTSEPLVKYVLDLI